MGMDKKTFIVIMGNILEYYDFVLFVHIGFIIIPLFFPNLSPNASHILTLFLFGISFITRPIGGYIFGKISDTKGREKALMLSVKWTLFPSVGLALLPDYAVLGQVSSILFILFRMIQGVALGGEYPIAGTYLMENNKQRQGFYSSLLVASGSIGSLIGLCIATLCSLPKAPEWSWRIAFLLGALGSIVSYYMRKYLKNSFRQENIPGTNVKDIEKKRILTFIISVAVGITVWIPITYSNFYVTKILKLSQSEGLYTSFIALFMYIIILPFVGMIFDKCNKNKYMTLSLILITPLSFLSIYLLSLQHITIAQLGLIIATAFISAPVHKVLNDIFPVRVRGKNVSFLLVLGLSFGGMLPGVSSYMVEKTGFFIIPAIFLSLVSIVTLFMYRKLAKYSD